MSPHAMHTPDASQPADQNPADGKRRYVRADAQRNIVSLRAAAGELFSESGVNAPARAIAARAGVGVGTLYRHFPKRSDLVAEVFRGEVDDCAATALAFAAHYGDEHIKALSAWLHRYMDFIVAKRGLAAALHSGDPAFSDLHDYFDRHLGPALDSLLAPAIKASQVRPDVSPRTILHAVRSVCLPDDDGTIDHVRPVIDLIIDGLRFGVLAHQTTPTSALALDALPPPSVPSR